jgi:hypothetical protein
VPVPRHERLALVRDAQRDDLVGGDPRLRNACGMIRSTLRQISTASCSTQPGRGWYWRCSRWETATSRAFWSNTMHRVDVVPWSIAITKRCTTSPSVLVDQ